MAAGPQAGGTEDSLIIGTLTATLSGGSPGAEKVQGGYYGLNCIPPKRYVEVPTTPALYL